MMDVSIEDVNKVITAFEPDIKSDLNGIHIFDFVILLSHRLAKKKQGHISKTRLIECSSHLYNKFSLLIDLQDLKPNMGKIVNLLFDLRILAPVESKSMLGWAVMTDRGQNMANNIEKKWNFSIRTNYALNTTINFFATKKNNRRFSSAPDFVKFAKSHGSAVLLILQGIEHNRLRRVPRYLRNLGNAYSKVHVIYSGVHAESSFDKLATKIVKEGLCLTKEAIEAHDINVWKYNELTRCIKNILNQGKPSKIHVVVAGATRLELYIFFTNFCIFKGLKVETLLPYVAKEAPVRISNSEVEILVIWVEPEKYIKNNSEVTDFHRFPLTGKKRYKFATMFAESNYPRMESYVHNIEATKFRVIIPKTQYFTEISKVSVDNAIKLQNNFDNIEISYPIDYRNYNSALAAIPHATDILCLSGSKIATLAMVRYYNNKMFLNVSNNHVDAAYTSLNYSSKYFSEGDGQIRTFSYFDEYFPGKAMYI